MARFHGIAHRFSTRSYRWFLLSLMLLLVLPLLSIRPPVQAQSTPEPVQLSVDGEVVSWAQVNDTLFLGVRKTRGSDLDLSKTYSSGLQIWKTDGTEAGTVLVKDFSPVNPDFTSLTPPPTYFRVIGDTLFFAADDGILNGVWKTDGTEAGTVFFGALGFKETLLINDTLFVQGYDSTHGEELWKTDGTEAGTVLVKDIYPGSDSSNPDSFTLVGDTLFFVADDGTHGVELWRTDGTEAGTALVKDIFPGADASTPLGFTLVDNTLFFIADDGTHGVELWKTDGTEAGTALVKDIYPGTDASSPRSHSFTLVGDTLFFTADDGTHGEELWKSDGTEAGTVLVKDIYPGTRASDSGIFRLVGDTLFFRADDGTHGNELWKSDGTEAGTVLVKDISPGSRDSHPFLAMDLGDTLFFTARSSIDGDEVWKTDGTEAGTVRFANLWRASLGIWRRVGDTMYFNAKTEQGSEQFWQSDGTEAGTVMVLNQPYTSLTSMNGTLFFPTYYGSLYALPLAPATTSTISGSITDANGAPLAGVTISASDGSSATTGSDGTYTLTGLSTGTYTLTPMLSGYTFDPASLTVEVPPNATGQDFTATADTPADSFQVDLDGFSFANFGYTGASWEHFKKTFPGTEMELPTGERRKGPERYFYSHRYWNVGTGGNCAGFTAVSLVRYLGLPETVETDLLEPAHRTISPLYNMPSPGNGPFELGESDIADYIHLYQARQLSWQYNQWWFDQGHQDDTPLEVFQSISQYTQNNEPVAVDIFQLFTDNEGRTGLLGHRMTAYRTEEAGTTGYIYVYDNNYPNDDTRRIEMNLSTGQWSYPVSPFETWSSTEHIRYAPGSVNFPASLPWWYDTDNLLQADGTSGIHLAVEGDATLLMTDSQGRRLGFENGSLVSEIPGAGYQPVLEYNPDTPEAPPTGEFFIPAGTAYTVAIEPTATGSYTLTAFADGSSLSLDNIAAAPGTTDMVTLNGGVRDATFAPATDDEYCHYVTLEVSEQASRDYTSCVNGAGATAFSLDETAGSLTIGNDGGTDITVDVMTDQVGSNAFNETAQHTLAAGEQVSIQPTNSSTVYLPLIQR
jgi:ELWxxDGT repeat protein